MTLSTNETSSMPSGCSTTEIWPNSDRSSSSRSRRSSRSLGMSPAVTKRRIESLSSAISRAICAISPPGSPAPAGRARSAYSAAAWSRVSAIWSCRVLNEPASELAVSATFCLSEGFLASPASCDHESQNRASCSLMPFSPGSLSASSARSSVLVRAAHSLQVGVLGAVLEVDELVADAAVGLDVDARAEVRAGAADDAAGRDLRARRRRRARPPGASSPWSTRWRCCGRRCPSGAAGPAGRAATSGVRRRRRSTRLGLEVEDAVEGRGGRLGGAGRRAGRSRPRARGRSGGSGGRGRRAPGA